MAKKSNELIFDEGFKEFNINGDPNRVIKFNPTDISIIERAQKVKREIGKEVEKLDSLEINDDEAMAQAVEQVNKIIKEKINYIFGSDVSDTVFGLQSPLASANGTTLAERFIAAALPVIQKEIEDENKKSKARVSKYTERYHK